MSDPMTIFAIVPVAAFLDKRLTLKQLRVLGALLSFRSKSSNTVWPSREAIAERCGMHLSSISTATSALERLGWLVKEGKGGFSKASRYTITVPHTVAQSATVADPATVAHSATSTVDDSARGMRVADSARGKELTKELTKEQSIRDCTAGFDKFWRAYGKPVGKKKSAEIWTRIRPDADLTRTIVAAASRVAATTEPRYRKDPERWLRDRRWEDEALQPQSIADPAFEVAL